MTAVRRMNTPKVKERKPVSRLRVVYNKKRDDRKAKRIDQLWVFCKAALWPNATFTEVEISNYKKLIAEHFKRSEEIDLSFRELIERICLAKRYVNRKPGRFISKPVDYLNINYSRGLAGTAVWYSSVQDQRKTVPHYNEGIDKLAKALLRYCLVPNLYHIRKAYTELHELKQHDLKQLYVNTIMQLQYFN